MTSAISINKFWLLPVALIFAGCAASPPYEFSASEPRSTVKFLEGGGSPSFCKDGQFYKFTFKPDAPREAEIPAGARVTVMSFMYYSGYNVSYSCGPALSFVPAEGEAYIFHDYVRQSRCYVEVVQVDEDQPAGIAPEPSMLGPSCGG